MPRRSAISSGSNRRPTHGRIVRHKFAAKPGQIESHIDLPYQMIFGNCLAKVKLVERLTLVNLPTARSWIDLAEIRVNTTESRVATSLN